ncbi:uncharacterized protein PGRI_088000 [Penicillium griseofulvum]|uniref:Uncharacterized protein n=1 Tax=Penicillium patulum TaxID=5078 RepID=A0A135LUA0_PENPA|nr:uncharacterized protein PGRI_088000 [Penicillium griseofulvum]KXG52516.1 hypothetical protein PGRI_088000 [Penicillium griseofulvum]
MMTLLEMANETLLKISLYLDYRDLSAFVRVNRHFYALSNKNLYSSLAKDSPGKAIAWAANTGNQASAQKLLQMCGLKILDEFFSEDREPIVIAASNGHTRLVQLFLPHCIQQDTEKKEDLVRKTLDAAIRKDHIAVVKLLLEDKADFNLNAMSKNAVAPLCTAVEMGKVSMVEIFLEHNYCDLNTSDLDDMTPLALAASGPPSSANLDIARLLLEASPGLYRDPELLLKAARSDNMPVMKFLLANNFNWRRLEWFDILSEFSQLRRKDHEVGSLLLSWMNVDSIMEIGSLQRCYLLRGAIVNGFEELLEKLLIESTVLDEDLHPNIRTHRFCHLSLAVCHNQYKSVELLLKHHADPNGKGKCRPIQFALERVKDDKIVRLLLHHGATYDPEKWVGTSEHCDLMNSRMAKVQKETC